MHGEQICLRGVPEGKNREMSEQIFLRLIAETNLALKKTYTMQSRTLLKQSTISRHVDVKH